LIIRETEFASLEVKYFCYSYPGGSVLFHISKHVVDKSHCLIEVSKQKKGKGTYSSLWIDPWQSYGTSPAIWDHTVLPAPRHRWVRPAFGAHSTIRRFYCNSSN